MAGPAEEVCDAYKEEQEAAIRARKEKRRAKLRKQGKKYDYLIVGAGLYGSVFARELTRSGKRCLVIDKRDHIGGNIYTEDVDGIQVHKYGAHIFHTSNTEVWKYVNKLTEFNNYINSPVAVYKDELYNLPFNMNTFYKMWGLKKPQEVKEEIARQIADLNITDPQNLEEQALSLVGRDVYEKLVKGYTEKQWGRDCRDLPSFIIRRLPLRFTYDNNYFNDRYQGIPVGGYTNLAQKLLDNVDVMTGTDFFEYRKENSHMYDKVIYTGMIDEYFDYCLGHLEYRTVRFETERLEEENYQGNAVMNYTERQIPYTRIIEHKHFAPEEERETPKPFTVISREYPQEWKPGMEPYYPVNDEKNSRLYEQYLELAKKEKNVRFGGRLGSYRYYDMDKVIEAALKDAEEELGRR
ncbi:MAG TPA: UDP-galactopyranose mutase [Candidatus Choladousia intestinigallinarum]|nr:UDP-galactopyranose mutase [Candidatus Choladousia intestinigallinarum]